MWDCGTRSILRTCWEKALFHPDPGVRTYLFTWVAMGMVSFRKLLLNTAFGPCTLSVFFVYTLAILPS